MRRPLRPTCWLAILCGAFALPGLAQDADPAAPPPSGWRRLGEPAQSAAPTTGDLTLPAGTWVKIRVDQPVSSKNNQPGDTFMATLSQPLVANGLVVARRGQSAAGVVALAEKGGRVKGTSRLGLELTEIGLADGRQVPVRTRLMEYTAGTSAGRDATAIGTTTGIGAAIGAAADGGFGAGMGAIAGAAASTIGVLLTRGHDTVVYPEAELTFRLEAPLTLPASPAFLTATSQDYEPRTLQQRRPTLLAPPPAFYPYYGYYRPYYYWGPSFFYYSGPRFYRGHGFRRR